MRAKESHGEGSVRLGRSPEYNAWAGMLKRCLPSCAMSRYYSERGIGVCDEWRASYLTFLGDVGRRPSRGHTLDRIDPDKGYEPGNVRWATVTEQSRNRRHVRKLAFRGEELFIPEWAARLGMSPRLIQERLRAGWPADLALSTPASNRRKLKGLIR